MPFPDDLFDRSALRQLAGDKTFERGEDLFKDGSVHGLRAGPDRAAARVQGASRTYRTKLWRSRGELQFQCDCGTGYDHVFCKHCVAVGLAWLSSVEHSAGQAAGGTEVYPAGKASSPSQSGGSAASAEPAVAPAELRAYISKLDKKRLLDLALEAIDYDEILRRRLMLETLGVAEGRRLGEAELKVYRRLLREAIEVSDYVDYDAMPDYVQGIEEALRPLDALLESGQPDAVIELCELALVELEHAADAVDASDGSLNHLYDELQRLHHAACREARPDPTRLAARLLEYELEGGLGIFNNAAATYADVLGPAGLAAYSRGLHRAWEKLQPRRHGAGSAADDAPAEIDHRRYQIVALMERFAVNSGADVDTRASIRARDLSSPQDYLAIAETYRDAGQLDQARDWAEKGLARFPGSLETSGLREFLIPLHARLGEGEKAVALVWTEFHARPNAGFFRKLQQFAPPETWPVWRERALQSVREHAKCGEDGSALVEILLSEGDVAAALAEARTHACRLDLWLELANRREAQAPAEALEIYRQQLDGIIARGDSRSYQQAAGLMRKIRHLFHALNRGGEFNVYRDRVRFAHRHRRGLVKLLDALGRG